MRLQGKHRFVQGQNRGNGPGKVRNSQKIKYKGKGQLRDENKIIIFSKKIRQNKKKNKMETIKIISEKENPLFARKEIVIEVKSGTNPKRTDLENSLAEKFSINSESIKVDRIVPKFGSNIFTIYARIYKSKEDKENIEPKIKAAKATTQNAK